MNQRIDRAGTAALKVVLVDDHTLFRRGLRDALVQEGLEVIGEASNGRAGVQLVLELDPDVVVMDLHMPQLDGVGAVRALLDRRPTTKVVMFTVSIDEDEVMDALTAGAAGYVLKSSPPDEIVRALQAVVRGDSVISPKVAGRLVERLRSTPPIVTPALPTNLTARELEILRLLAEGRENHEIAARLVISPSTAKNHVASVLEKLGLENRVQAAVYAVRAGLV